MDCLGLLFELTPSGSTSQDLWSYVAVNDPKNANYGAPGSAFDNPPYALVFYTVTAAIFPGDALGGFGYISPFSGVNVPFIAGFDDLSLTIGDPVGPKTDHFPNAKAVPEPGSLLLLCTGLASIGCMAWLKKRTTVA